MTTAPLPCHHDRSTMNDLACRVKEPLVRAQIYDTAILWGERHIYPKRGETRAQRDFLQEMRETHDIPPPERVLM